MAEPDLDAASRDPILRTFSVPMLAPAGFDMSGFFSPISIKDQIVRATLVIERAVRHRLISTDRPLLVIGAGVPGITAALTALRTGVPTTIVEKKTPLHQLKSTRYFCPVQYDWNADHWDRGRFPWDDGGRTTVELHAGPAEDFVSDLLKRLEEARRVYSRLLSIHSSVELKSVAIDGDMAAVDFKVAATDAAGLPAYDSTSLEYSRQLPPSGQRFGVALSCAGFARENVGVGNFAGFRFWSMSGHEKFAAKGNVMICGGGDGALQDFLMFATKVRSAKEIYFAVSSTASGAEPGLAGKFANAADRIGRAEERAKRTEIWLRRDHRADVEELCAIYDALHRAHLAEAEMLLAEPGVRRGLDAIVRPEAASRVRLAHSCTHFSACYPLNRFLALLVGLYLREKGGEPFHPATSLVDVASDDARHVCAGNASACSRHPHRPVLLGGSTCVGRTSAAGGPVDPKLSEAQQLIVVRYGLGHVASVFGAGPGRAPAFPGPQILPFGL